MRQVRRLAIVLLALGVVTAAIYATGAFTNLTAQRDANVAVTGDASAYLSLKPSSGPNGVYASYDENGQLQIVLGDDATGSGVNRDAVTIFRDVFTITNQGSQTIGLWLTDESDAVTFQVNGQSIESKGQAIIIAPGTTKFVGLVIDTRQVGKGQDLLESVTFHSSSEVSGSSGGSGTVGSRDQPSMDSPPSSQTAEPPASPSKEGDDGSNSKYEDCAWWDVGCHGRNAEDFLGSILSGGDNGDGSPSEKSIDDAAVRTIGSLVPVVGPILANSDKIREGFNDDTTARLIGTLIPGAGYILTHPDKVRDRFLTEEGDFDLTGDETPIGEEINDRIHGIPRGDFDGDGTRFWNEPVDFIIVPLLDHDDFPGMTTFSKGVIYGSMGQEGGFVYKEDCHKWTCVSDEAADSTAYLAGSVGFGVALAVAAVFTGGTAGVALAVVSGAMDLRNGIQSIANEKYWMAALNFAGFIPIMGDLAKGGGEFLSTVSKMDEVSDLKRLIKFAPDSVGVKLLGTVSDAPVQKLYSKGIPMEDIIKYVDADDVNYQLVLELRSKGMDIPAEDIRFYVNKDIDLGLVKKARKGGSNRDVMSPNKIRSIFSDGAHESIEKLAKKQGYSLEEIDDLMSKGVEPKVISDLRAEEISKVDIKYLANEGADMKKIRKVLKQEVSLEDVKFYVDNDISLGGVSKLRKIGYSPKGIKKLSMYYKPIAKRYDKALDSNKLTKKDVRIANRKVDIETKITKQALTILKASTGYSS
jgi:DNA-binding transcriptional MerR regulator